MLGPIETLWKSTGGVTGSLGYPITSVSTAADKKGQYAKFQHGSIYWSSATGARAMLGPIETLWQSTGAEHGSLGYPTTSVSTAADHAGQYARFQHGSISWSSSTGAHIVGKAIYSAWMGTGAETGRLGYPTRDAYAVAGGTRTDFQHGYITVSSASGAVTVHVN
jgi:uncharacterized protein with LGFP repeats